MRMIATVILTMVFLISSAPAVPDRYREEKIAKLKQQQEFERFIHALGQRESGNRNYAINSIGCIGRWQIAPGTLKYLGYDITPARFKRDPNVFPEGLQRQILEQLFRINELILKDYISHYSGIEIGGVVISKAGILAASHLSGAGGVKKYLLSMGKKNPKDLNGTTVKKYLSEFSGFAL